MSGQEPANLILADNEVHIWSAALERPSAQVEQLAQTLSADEQARADRFYFERDRLRFIVGRGLLRVILGRYLGLEPAGMYFDYSAQGKPALAETGLEDKRRLCFNLAHSHRLAVYAFSRGREIGVDVEHIRPIAEAEQIAERFFSAPEITLLQALPLQQKQETFFIIWTRKEAYLKAVGAGLARPLDQFDVSLGPKLVIPGDPQEAARWSICDLKPAEGFVAALAVTGNDWQLKIFQEG
jgi:4'-phosphopantetheinyl transferase